MDTLPLVFKHACSYGEYNGDDLFSSNYNFFFKYIRLKIYVFIDIEDSKYRKECSSESPTWRSSHGVKMKIVAWVSKTSIIDGWIITGTESPHFTSHSSQHKYILSHRLQTVCILVPCHHHQGCAKCKFPGLWLVSHHLSFTFICWSLSSSLIDLSINNMPFMPIYALYVNYYLSAIRSLNFNSR